MAGRKTTQLTPRQRLFVTEYLVDLKGGEAAKRAGYPANSAITKASNMLATPEIASAVAKGAQKRIESTELTVDRVLTEIGRLAFFDIRKIYDEDGNLKPVHLMDDDTAAAIASMDLHIDDSGQVVNVSRVKTYDKVRALEMAAKYLRLFVEQHDVHHSVGVSLNFDLTGKP